MKIYRYLKQGKAPNFGDDLNRWMWNRILGEQTNVDDGTLLLAIGTVLSRHLVPAAARYVVFTSGTDSIGPPNSFGGPDWEILAVRGPLTAQVLGLDRRKAVTDGAALLRLLPEFEPLPEEMRRGIAFMPHYTSLPYGRWDRVCEIAGFDFLDPCAPSEITVGQIRRARLVLADAMHAAIVADALRVPWVPVATSPQIDSFKWLDWTMSLDLPYEPIRLPAPTLMEAIRCNYLTLCGDNRLLRFQTTTEAIKHLRRVQWRWSWKHYQKYRWYIERSMLILPTNLLKSRGVSHFAKWQDEKRTRQAVDHLHYAAKARPYLSDEQIFTSRLNQLTELLPRLWTGMIADTVSSPSS